MAAPLMEARVGMWVSCNSRGGPTKWVAGENILVDKESEEGHNRQIIL